jgi:vancomycin aglycone glucosyltransferase
MLREQMKATVDGQFATLSETAADCDVIVGCNQLQVAARSAAELRGIRYVFADFSPIALPSPHHAPPPMSARPPTQPAAGNLTLWERDAELRNTVWRAPLNEMRAAAGLPPVADVRSHILTDRPLLAADPALAPWPTPSQLAVTQTGAWILRDRRPLAADLEEFLAAGGRPIYFGFGSMREPEQTSRAVVEAARLLGYRAIVLRGWADLSPVDGEADCLFIGETNLQALFSRVAAVVHHGGAGTTTTATRCGVPQVVIPRVYDQFYFARRVQELGIGLSHTTDLLTADTLAEALKQILRLETTMRAQSVAVEMRTDGAMIAAGLVS